MVSRGRFLDSRDGFVPTEERGSSLRGCLEPRAIPEESLRVRPGGLRVDPLDHSGKNKSGTGKIAAGPLGMSQG